MAVDCKNGSCPRNRPWTIGGVTCICQCTSRTILGVGNSRVYLENPCGGQYDVFVLEPKKQTKTREPQEIVEYLVHGTELLARANCG